MLQAFASFLLAFRADAPPDPTPMRGARAQSFRDIFVFANFGLSKAVIYAAPLLIAGLAAPAVYGAVELGLAFGLFFASLAAGAPLNGIVQQHLVLGKREVRDQVALVGCAMCGLAVVAALAARGSAGLALAAALAGVAGLQLALATFCRLFGRPVATAWADGLSVLLAAGLAATFWLAAPPGPTVTTLGAAFLLIAAAGCAACACLFAALRRPGVRARLAEAARIGAPMLVSGLFGVWLAVSGRLLMGLFSPQDLPAYGVAFRMTGLAIGLYQLANTIWFIRIYKGKTREADRILAILVALGFAASALIALAGAPAAALLDLDALAGRQGRTFEAILPIVGLQAGFWVAHSLLVVRVNRCGVAGSTILPNVLVTLVSFGLIVLLRFAGLLDAVILAWLLAAQAGGYFLVSIRALGGARLPHRRAAAAGLAGAALLALIAL